MASEAAGNSTRSSTTVGGVVLRNPVMLAAGTCGTLHEMAGVLDLSGVGGLVSKSITRTAREGNPTHRILDAGERVSGMMNAIGLANPGVETFVRDYVPRGRGLDTTLFGSVAGYSIDEYGEVAERLDATGLFAGIELNVSCPNVKTGTEFGSSGELLGEMLRAVVPMVKKARVFVKLAPTTGGGGGIEGIARVAMESGASGLTIGNTVPGMMIDVGTRKPRLANVTGGLSGPAIHPIAVRAVHVVHRSVTRDALGKGKHFPIIGVGGVSTWEDAAEFVLAGACAVQMGTALYADPRSPMRVARGLEKWVESMGAGNISELVGAVELGG